jgi:Nucleotidyl transferase AbiEii toxin, Type IV TA system
MTIANNPILTESQKSLLAQFAASSLNDTFYLSGATALSAFYLQHRFSEDLDFFTESDFGIEDVLDFVKSLPGTKDSHYERKYDRRIFLLDYANTTTLKLEFTRYPFPQLEAGTLIGGIRSFTRSTRSRGSSSQKVRSVKAFGLTTDTDVAGAKTYSATPALSAKTQPWSAISPATV